MNNPLKDTPAEITDKLTRWGGKNEYGDPHWRIILAENHLVQRAGMWTEFADDTEQFHFEGRGSQIVYNSRQIAPQAIRTGMQWVPLYPCTGWILERWFPAQSFGMRSQWEEAKSTDGTPMMGPYPERGGYFMLSGGGPWEEIPLLESVREAISHWENSAHLHGHMDAEAIDRAVRQDMIRSEDVRKVHYERLLNEMDYARKFNLGFIKGTPALSGFRNRLTNRHGLMSHV